ncbi:cytochrome C551 [Methanosarcinales archaeon ex4572_44]|nr:MAG: cytochrome C551 [Methanosarcinales archaeon ex4572_44]RLG25535.1 MAG: cytochrome C551 [Methanosarcinales archaeon]RLG26793.1 MAG: cytochrome C551 [Methanosarcinales archaeon]HHI30477.1 cytochrome C551 [Candidatus Methanoperedenaceae archaeon]
MEDRTLVCKDCGEEFVFTAGEQEFFEEKGFDDPQRCKECRERRKSERRNRGFRRY